MSPRPMPSTAAILQKLDYDPASGEFVWKVSPNGRVLAGTTAGSKRDGYILIAINGLDYYAQRLAWVICHGSIPDGMMIDHINHDKTDNRISNLRIATNGQNLMNSKLRVDNKSGIKGVSWNRQSNKWDARIRVSKTTVYLGRFDSIETAGARVKEAREAHHKEFSNHCSK